MTVRHRTRPLDDADPAAAGLREYLVLPRITDRDPNDPKYGARLAMAVLLVIVVALALLILGRAFAESEPALDLTVRPRVAFAPADLWVRVRIAPHPDNRRVRIATAGGDRVSAWEVSGASAPILHERLWRDCPAGEYVVRATLYGPRARVRGTDEETVLLVGP